jgi:acetyl esterase
MKKHITLHFIALRLIFWIFFYCSLNIGAQDDVSIKRLVKTYKKVKDTQLKAHIVIPDSYRENALCPTFIFFHGGGWSQGKPENGIRMCNYWAKRGMVAISFEYRLADSSGVTPIECIKDAKSAIRWVRSQAKNLGVDPCKIVATGGSAGGHLAVSTAILEGFEETNEETNISSRPNAVIVWSAAVNVVGDNWFKQLLGDRAEAHECSPAHHIRPNLPPMALLHGTDDATVPYWTIEQFANEMQEVGNRCELYTYANGDHIFHVKNREDVLSVMDKFLISLDFLN